MAEESLTECWKPANQIWDWVLLEKKQKKNKMNVMLTASRRVESCRVKSVRVASSCVKSVRVKSWSSFSSECVPPQLPGWMVVWRWWRAVRDVTLVTVVRRGGVGLVREGGVEAERRGKRGRGRGYSHWECPDCCLQVRSLLAWSTESWTFHPWTISCVQRWSFPTASAPEMT